MKKIKSICITSMFALAFLCPQTASAYKYYVTLTDGTQVMFHASSKMQAISYFREHFSEGVLSSRPGGGYLDHM